MSPLRSLIAGTMLGALACLPGQIANAQEQSNPDQPQETSAVNLPSPMKEALEALTPDQQRRFLSLVGGEGGANDQQLLEIDALVTELPQESLFRYILLTNKGSLLASAGRADEAKQQFAALIAQFPRNLAVRMAAIESLIYSPQNAQAANWWLELANQNPRAANQIDSFALAALAGNLQTSGLHELRAQLLTTLVENGYDAGSGARRSELALDVAEVYIAAGQTEQARQELVSVTEASQQMAILENASFEKFWPDIPFANAATRSAIIRQELITLIQDASQERDGVLAGQYLSKAAGFAGPEFVIKNFAPRLKSVMAKGAADTVDHNYTYWVAPVANAYILAGEHGAAKALYGDGMLFFASLDSVARLNSISNYAFFLQAEGRNAEALPLIDQSIADLEKIGGSEKALVQMHAVRVLALDGLGKLTEEDRSWQALKTVRTTELAVFAGTMLRLGRLPPAKAVILESLNSKDYEAAVSFLQRPLEAYQSTYEIETDALREPLRGDADVLAALAGKGRILDFAPIKISDLPVADIDQ